MLLVNDLQINKLKLKLSLCTDCSTWNFDGSSTYQAVGENSDMFLEPAALFKDPFRGGRHKILLCDVYDSEKKPVGK